MLLHVLPHAQGLPEVPSSPDLLPVVDSGMDGEHAYLVTELPLLAHPAQDPLLTARGALAALSALHAHGLAHGGVSRAQLWNYDGGVALAGAGLPWGEYATPEGDLSDLVLTLQALGGLPGALRPLLDRPGSLNAGEALALITGDAAGQEVSLTPVPDQSTVLEASRAGTQTAQQDVTVQPDSSGPLATASEISPDRSDETVLQPELDTAANIVVLTTPPASAESGNAVPEQAQPSATSPFSNAPVGQTETPQERRKRQNDERREQAMVDSRAAAGRKAARLKAQQEEEQREVARAAEQAALGVPVPEPFQMGFAEGQAESGGAAGVTATSGPQTRRVERLPASLRRAGGGQVGAAVQRLPGGASAGRPTSARNLTPIKIGWDEDDSWRVVRTAPKKRQAAPPLRWLPLVLVLIVLLGAALWWSLRAAPAAPAASSGGVGAAAATGSPDVVFGGVQVVATTAVPRTSP